VFPVDCSCASAAKEPTTLTWFDQQITLIATLLLPPLASISLFSGVFFSLLFRSVFHGDLPTLHV